ncbi:DUF6082 family protein [Spongiactinospora sp. TRM90649]|uniref:DUF6082 family protein n=1 Tax=Spongiactinospora sp. TRM90649 TaxID=3031114 RepID=UPI0023FA13FC|nr:DUF6082 family protein [Spongiactinospora sp. TRM90649]MDF5754898.1 DUF6082 family protein [Spongiactinospora sp. TRM90649]
MPPRPPAGKTSRVRPERGPLLRLTRPLSGPAAPLEERHQRSNSPSLTPANRATRKEAERGYHAQILSMALNDPVYLRCWGSLDLSRSDEETRRHLYLNLILSYWEMLYELGEMPDDVLREYIRADFLATRPGYLFWEQTRRHRMDAVKSKRMRRFYEIMNSEFQNARLPPPVREETSEKSPETGEIRERLVTAELGAAGVVGVWALWRRVTRRGFHAEG